MLINQLKERISLHEALLPQHPDMIYRLRNQRPYPTKINMDDVRETARLMKTGEALAAKEELGRSTLEITGILSELTTIAIKRISTVFGLDKTHDVLPPKVLWCDTLSQLNEKVAGYEDGYYELNSSCFVPFGHKARDTRLRWQQGPAILYLGNPCDQTITEESVHYLQWAHEVGAAKLEAIRDYSNRHVGADVMFQKLPGHLSHQLIGSKTELSSFENCAAHVLYEACAALYRFQTRAASDSFEGILERFSKIDTTLFDSLKGYDCLQKIQEIFGLDGIEGVFDHLCSTNNAESYDELCRKAAVNAFTEEAKLQDGISVVQYFLAEILARGLFLKISSENDFKQLAKCFFPGPSNQASASLRVTILSDYAKGSG